MIKTDVTFPLSEYGSLMVSELGEPLGISMACRADPKPESIVLPLINVLHSISRRMCHSSLCQHRRPQSI